MFPVRPFIWVYVVLALRLVSHMISARSVPIQRLSLMSVVMAAILSERRLALRSRSYLKFFSSRSQRYTSSPAVAIQTFPSLSGMIMFTCVPSSVGGNPPSFIWSSSFSAGLYIARPRPVPNQYFPVGSCAREKTSFDGIKRGAVKEVK